MRGLALALATLAACGGDDGGAPVDAGVDGGPFDGTWNATWTCTQVCSPRPDITQTTTLTVSGLTLTYAGGPGGTIHHAMEVNGCLDVDRQTEGNLIRQPYSLCIDGLGLEASLFWTGNPSVMVWRVQAWR